MEQLTALFDFSDVQSYLPDLLMGALTTVELTLVVTLLALVFGLVVALMRLSSVNAVRWLASTYVEIMRGTPLILQLFYVYFVLPAFGISISAFLAAVLALTLNYSAYISEVYRAGIKAIPHGQIEASTALGLSHSKTMRFIIIPQAFRIVVPPLGNYFLSLFKDTALASTVTVHELMFVGQVTASSNFKYFAIYTIIGLIYLVLSYPGSLLVQYLERRMTRAYGR